MREYISCDMSSFNNYYRNKLKRSMTYQICNGYFKNVRAIIDSDPTNDFIDINETDEWWVDNENFRNKNAAKNIGKLFACSNIPSKNVHFY